MDVADVALSDRMKRQAGFKAGLQETDPARNGSNGIEEMA
jgi:hypothetical protein